MFTNNCILNVKNSETVNQVPHFCLKSKILWIHANYDGHKYYPWSLHTGVVYVVSGLVFAPVLPVDCLWHVVCVDRTLTVTCRLSVTRSFAPFPAFSPGCPMSNNKHRCKSIDSDLCALVQGEIQLKPDDFMGVYHKWQDMHSITTRNEYSRGYLYDCYFFGELIGLFFKGLKIISLIGMFD